MWYGSDNIFLTKLKIHRSMTTGTGTKWTAMAIFILALAMRFMVIVISNGMF